MNLKDLLSKKKSSLTKKWFDAIIENYPADASHFLKEQKNRFHNPVGHTISEGIEKLFDEILEDADSEKIYPILNDIIKIKAVQDFSPSKAVSFFFLFKRIIRNEMGSEIMRHGLSEELTLLEAQIDKLTLLSFDIYMKCRERIYEIKSDESRRMMFRLLQRANLICEVQDDGTLLSERNSINSRIKG